MKLILGFSPCPNDTFIFDAMVHGRIDTEGLEFDFFLGDVEELNRRAIASDADILKISTHVYALVADNYLILDSGSALGFGNGPLIVSRETKLPAGKKDLRIAIPGKHTTANLLLSIFRPDITDKPEFLFSDIPGVILRGEADGGLIIHETRFTYRSYGLYKICDLGMMWEDLTRLPVPLGSIVINRRISYDIALKVNNIIRRSITYALDNSSAASEFVTSHARETESSVITSHIKLFVNEFTLNLGDQGRKAVSELFRRANEKGALPAVPANIFLATSKTDKI